MKYIWKITPVSAPRMMRSDAWKERPCVLRYHRFRDEVNLEMNRANIEWHLLDSLDVSFYIPMPKSWSRKKKSDLIGNPHQQKPDLDNLVKALLDAIFRDGDDCRVFSIRARKLWSTEGKMRITI